MRVQYYSIHESFDAENPLARAFLGVGRGWRRRAPTLTRWIFVLLVSAAWTVASYFHFAAPNIYATAWAGLVSILVFGIVSIASPFMGQWTRQSIDRHPMTADALNMTPLTQRDKLAAVHGRILQWAGIPASLAVVFFLSLQFIILRQWLVGTARLEPMPWAMLLMTALGLSNWVAGCYLRATLPATTRFRFWPAFLGPALVLLMAGTAFWAQIESEAGFMALTIEIERRSAFTVRLNSGLTAWACCAMAVWLAARLAVAAICWRMALKGAQRVAELERVHGIAPKRKLPFFC